MTVFGEHYAKVYDDVYSDKDTGSEVDAVLSLAASMGVRSPGRLLDIGCGTGRHAIDFARRGIDVVGVDRSEQMLTVARRQASAEPPVTIHFEQADAGSLPTFDPPFDVAAMLFAVLSYLTTDAAIERALSGIFANLRPGGAFVADAWWGPAVLATGLQRRERTITTPEGPILRRSEGRPVPGDSRLVDVSIELIDRHGRVTTSEIHRMRSFDEAGLDAAATRAGLELVHLSSQDDPHEAPSSTSWTAMIGLRRPSH